MVAKAMNYDRGGRSGTFAGSATFSSFDFSSSGISASAVVPSDGSDNVPAIHQPTKHLLSFYEQGTATLDASSSGMAPVETLSACSRLLYDCDGDGDVAHCFFDEGYAADEPDARLAAARFFHSISLPGLTLTEHPCGPDVYRGTLIWESDDAFRLEWRVSGPRKLGTVVSRFRRLRPSDDMRE